MNQINFSLALSIFVLSLTSNASNYPADAMSKVSWQTQSNVTVLRGLQFMNNLAVLDITYTGALAGTAGLKIWVKIGDKQMTVPMTTFATEKGHVAFLRITGGCLVGILGGCQAFGSGEMRDLLIWAQRQDGTLNAINIQLAFYNEKNEWDNNGQPGIDYQFQFQQD